MAEYIEREEAKKFFNLNFGGVSHAIIAARLLDEIPAADVAPVVHGRWVKRGCNWQCTHCKVLMSIDGTPKENMLNYCPNCGAKMDEEK